MMPFISSPTDGPPVKFVWFFAVVCCRSLISSVMLQSFAPSTLSGGCGLQLSHSGHDGGMDSDEVLDSDDIDSELVLLRLDCELHDSCDCDDVDDVLDSELSLLGLCDEALELDVELSLDVELALSLDIELSDEIADRLEVDVLDSLDGDDDDNDEDCDELDRLDELDNDDDDSELLELDIDELDSELELPELLDWLDRLELCEDSLSSDTELVLDVDESDESDDELRLDDDELDESELALSSLLSDEDCDELDRLLNDDSDDSDEDSDDSELDEIEESLSSEAGFPSQTLNVNVISVSASLPSAGGVYVIVPSFSLISIVPAPLLDTSDITTSLFNSAASQCACDTPSTGWITSTRASTVAPNVVTSSGVVSS